MSSKPEASQPHSIRWLHLVNRTRFNPKRIGDVLRLIGTEADTANVCDLTHEQMLDALDDPSGNVTLALRTLQRYLKAADEGFGFLHIEVLRGRIAGTEKFWGRNRYTLTFPKVTGHVMNIEGEPKYSAEIPDFNGDTGDFISIVTGVAHPEHYLEELKESKNLLDTILARKNPSRPSSVRDVSSQTLRELPWVPPVGESSREAQADGLYLDPFGEPYLIVGGRVNTDPRLIEQALYEREGSST